MIRRTVRKQSRWPLLFLLIPFVALLWPPFYDKADPQLFSIPFFYWYQLLCIILTALLTIVAYFMGA
jgi:hypothetical protein